MTKSRARINQFSFISINNIPMITNIPPINCCNDNFMSNVKYPPINNIKISRPTNVRTRPGFGAFLIA